MALHPLNINTARLRTKFEMGTILISTSAQEVLRHGGGTPAGLLQLHGMTASTIAGTSVFQAEDIFDERIYGGMAITSWFTDVLSQKSIKIRTDANRKTTCIYLKEEEPIT